MNFADLSKEQKQYLILGSVVALVLILGIVFSVRFRQTSVSEARRELEDLSGKISRADRELSRRSKAKAEFEKTVISLKGYLENVPPTQNSYSWATDMIYSTARAAGLEVDAIEEIKTSVSGKGKKSVRLELFSLRITGRGGFENVKQFLQYFEEDQPLVRLSGLEISARAEPNMHDVQLFIQWPFNLSEIAQLGDYVDKMPVIVADKSSAPVLKVPAQHSELPPKSVRIERNTKPSVEKIASVEVVSKRTRSELPVSEPKKRPEPVHVSVPEPDASPNIDKVPKTTESDSVPATSARVFLPRGIDRNSNADKKLVELLQKQEPEADETLGSFLDGLVEEIYE